MKNTVAFLFATLYVATICTPIPARAANSTLSGTIDQAIDSRTSVVGQRFTLSHVASTDRTVGGATAFGHFAEVVLAASDRPASVLLAFDRLHLVNGKSFSIDGSVIGVSTDATGASSMIVGRAAGTSPGTIVNVSGGSIYADGKGREVAVPINANLTFRILRKRAIR